MTYLPEGLRSEMNGVSAEMRRKSSSRKSTPAERACEGCEGVVRGGEGGCEGGCEGLWL